MWAKIKAWGAALAALLALFYFGHRWLTHGEREALKLAKEQRDAAINTGDKLAEATAEGTVARIRLAASERSKRPMRERRDAALADARAAREAVDARRLREGS